MAAITPVAGPKKFYVLRDATAQANTGQTDWIDVPDWARFATVHFNLTAVAGTTPLVTELNVLVADPVRRDDSNVIPFAEQASITDLSGAAELVINIGPGITGIANEFTNGATGDSWLTMNGTLQPLMGFQVTLDRTTGDETYTYSLAVVFKG